MTVAIAPKDAKEWFGAVPPDLSVIARSRAGANGSGADYLYTYMRSFYRDTSKPTGWNNLVFPSVGMPHVLWELQGEQRAVFEEHPDPHDAKKTVHSFKGFELAKPGKMSKEEFDNSVADLVAYLQWMGEPRTEPACSSGRLGAAVPCHLYHRCLAYECLVLERRQVNNPLRARQYVRGPARSGGRVSSLRLSFEIRPLRSFFWSAQP